MVVAAAAAAVAVILMVAWSANHLRPAAGVMQKPRREYPVSWGFGGSWIWVVNPKLAMRAMSLPALSKKSCLLTP